MLDTASFDPDLSSAFAIYEPPRRRLEGMKPNARTSLLQKARLRSLALLAAAGVGTAGFALAAHAATASAAGTGSSTASTTSSDDSGNDSGDDNDSSRESEDGDNGLFGLQPSTGSPSHGSSHSS